MCIIGDATFAVRPQAAAGTAKAAADAWALRDAIEDGTNQGLIRLDLKYGPRGEQIITAIKRVSKPSCRVYCGVEELPRVLGGLGISIVSTPRGVLSDIEARKQNVGGEVLCQVF